MKGGKKWNTFNPLINLYNYILYGEKIYTIFFGKLNWAVFIFQKGQMSINEAKLLQTENKIKYLGVKFKGLKKIKNQTN